MATVWGRVKEAYQRVWERAKEAYQRVWERRGYERETAVLVLKSAVAATLALAVGMPLDPQGSFVGFAPFSALLIVQPSVYGAVYQSWRYVAAVVAGALFAGAGGLTVGLEIWSFALAVLAALVVGQVRFFGGQGKQVPVVAAFALANGSAESVTDLGQLLLMVGLGALSALLTNLVMAPAIRFRDAENAVLDFTDTMRDITTGLTEELRGEVDESRIDYWTRRSESLDNIADNAWDTVERQENRVRLNPRRLLSPPNG
ncbi:aromatic acid exporter family protein [Nocardiopsis kunsanensis]|uniref:aromatic acid exporter family protein n=1 Tax=Nocardiopsis kunsanensis TaxID=141693 RepID=UPI00037A41DF|nr:aromatic acid exporter family protein [Nocardiopsis kunsanensis]